MTIDPRRQSALFATFGLGLFLVPFSVLYAAVGGLLFGTQWLVVGVAAGVAGIVLLVTALYVAYDEGHPQ